MKALIAVVAVAGISAAGAWFAASNQQAARFQTEKQKLQAQWDEEKTRLDRDLKRARSQSPRVETVTETVEIPVAHKASPQQILSKLTSLKPPAGETERIRALREIIHYLETLADLGEESLPHIRSFLAQNVDIPYERERERDREGENQGQGGPGGDGRGPGGDRGPGDRVDMGMLFGNGPGVQRTQNYYPYSLRLGLFDVLAKIGGSQAEQILLESLASTGRGVEVYHLDSLLGERHKDAAIAAAKDLLANPLAVANPTRLDERSKDYCYEILRKYEDTSFLGTAKLLLIGANGRLDPAAFRYITRVEREAAMSTIYQTYRDPRLTNNLEKAALVNAAAQYAGPNPTANQLINEAVVTALQSMNQNRERGEGRDGREAGAALGVISRLDNGELQPDVIQSRLALLNTLNQTVASNTNPEDRRTAFVQEMIQRTAQNLQQMLNPAAAQNNDGRNRGPGGFGGGDRGPGGFRGGPPGGFGGGGPGGPGGPGGRGR